MPIILRCAVCGVPCGQMETPCYCGEKYMEISDGTTIDGGLYSSDKLYFFCSEKCHLELRKHHPQDFSMCGTFISTGN